MAAKARERVRRRRVRPLLVVLLIIMLLEGAIAWIDRQAGVKLCEHCYGREVRQHAHTGCNA